MSDLREEGGDPTIIPLALQNFIYSACPHPECFGVECKWEVHTAETREPFGLTEGQIEPYFILLFFALLHFIDVAFFYNLKTRPSTSKMITTYLIEILTLLQ